MTARRLVAFCLATLPALCSATDLSVVVGGWSHHFVSASDRDGLNQSQGTVGVELTTADWDFQASHLTDSFGCSSNQGALARRWEMFSPQPWLRGGLMLGAVATHRCSSPPVSYEGLRLVGTSNRYIFQDQLSPGLYAACPDGGAGLCFIYEGVKVTERPAPEWHYGLIPGAFLDLGENVQLETSLIRSPWTGHHFVLYWQLSVKLFSF